MKYTQKILDLNIFLFIFIVLVFPYVILGTIILDIIVLLLSDSECNCSEDGTCGKNTDETKK